MDALDEIRENRRERARLAARVGELDAQLPGPDGLVQAAFDAGHDGPEIARVVGVSKPRVYQLRDDRR
ncbi:hypothetical protein [Williamsia sterculiae]|uniref:Homeodomain-like domain-containing protein n=1 Tax=Williamsia sterculiae TaxID=1344003 RepID=A0A1N7HDY2_9NOCA|nr:hypothetical protein [Williamsia sterculiae]SIS23086.1 hypothetical protein SAMN05445060_4049 [Williamsia sterculiae]